MNYAGVVALDNVGKSSYSFSRSRIEAYTRRGPALSFTNTSLLVDSGSGVEILTLDDVAEGNDLI